MSFIQRCKVCGRPSEIDFTVSDETWERVVPLEFRNTVVCLGCFDCFASQKGEDYVNDLGREVRFAGLKSQLMMIIRERIEADGKC